MKDVSARSISPRHGAPGVYPGWPLGSCRQWRHFCIDDVRAMIRTRASLMASAVVFFIGCVPVGRSAPASAPKRILLAATTTLWMADPRFRLVVARLRPEPALRFDRRRALAPRIVLRPGHDWSSAFTAK